MNRRTFLAVSLSPSAFGAWKGAPPKEFVPSLRGWMQVAPVPGVWVTSFYRGRVTWAEGFGVKNADTKQPVDGQSIFEAASLTKQFTAYLAHALQGEGKLDFDKPLNDYVEGMTDPIAKTVTARHVLSHSSGFPNWRPKESEALVPDFPPGERFRYSGEGYVYLSRVLEKVADKAFGELVQQRIFGPLEMNNSSVARMQEREDRMATGHDRRGKVNGIQGKKRFWESANGMKPVASWRYEDAEAAVAKAKLPKLPDYITPNAAASFCTTGPDYAKFVLHAIKNLELRKQQTRISEGDGWSLGWGLGWGTEHVNGRDYLWQWGDNGGYKNIVIVDPIAQSGVFVFTNGDSGMRICDRVVTHCTGIEHPAFLWVG